MFSSLVLKLILLCSVVIDILVTTVSFQFLVNPELASHRATMGLP